MDTWVIVVLVVVIAAAAIVWFYMSRKRSEHLRGQFGPEYTRALKEHGSQRRAEADLESREKRVKRFNIRPLPPSDRDQFANEWRLLQTRFVDDPPGAVMEADRLVAQVMEARGYPTGDYDQRIDDLSVEHPRVLDNYRKACEIARRNDRGEASTEDLRSGMVSYRALFEDLLEIPAEHVQPIRR